MNSEVEVDLAGGTNTREVEVYEVRCIRDTTRTANGEEVDFFHIRV